MKDNDNLKNENAPTGETLQVSPSSSFNNKSSILPIDISNKKKEDTKEALLEGNGSTSASKGSEDITNKTVIDTNERTSNLKREVQNCLFKMAEHALGISSLNDFDDVFNQAIRSYMELTGVDKAKAAGAVDRGFVNFKRGIEEDRRKNMSPQAQLQVQDEVEPF